MAWWKRLVNKIGGSADEPGPGEGGEIQLRAGTAQFEWFVARSELETTGDLKHGASHLGCLLSFDPGKPEWLELLERYLAAGEPDPESLIPRGEELHYTTEAMRAYIWHKQGRLQEAVDLLVQVVGAKPDARYLEAWGLKWLEPAGAMESLSPQSGLMLFSVILNRFPEVRYSPRWRLRHVRRWARLVERFASKLPSNDMAIMARAGLLRKAGLFDDALAVVRPVLKRAPNWHAATALGLILRQQGKCSEAEAAFRQALAVNPEDISSRLEAADAWFEFERWPKALAWYQKALATDPKHPWALPSALFCRWKISGDDEHLRNLARFAKTQSNSVRAMDLCKQVMFAELPEPADATANLLRHLSGIVQEKPAEAPTGEFPLNVSCLEAPSNTLAFRLEMELLDWDLSLKVSTGEIPKPDPRVPIVEGPYVLWLYDGKEPFPGLHPPGSDVVQLIAKLAGARYDPAKNWASASHVAAKLGAGRVGEILACMVHPPAVPKGSHALQWLPRVQLAAAQVAAHVDEGWEGSMRRKALMSVLLGPSDWATEAAIRALTRLGMEYEVIAPDIHDAFGLLAKHRPNGGHCCWEHTLYRHWPDLPHLFDVEREALQQRLREVEAWLASD